MSNPQTQADTLTLHVRDATGQREFTASGIPKDVSWGEAMQSILSNMDLPKNNPSGESIWMGRLEREGRHIHSSEIVGNVLEDGDKVVLAPEVNAGLAAVRMP